MGNNLCHTSVFIITGDGQHLESRTNVREGTRHRFFYEDKDQASFVYAAGKCFDLDFFCPYAERTEKNEKAGKNTQKCIYLSQQQ